MKQRELEIAEKVRQDLLNIANDYKEFKKWWFAYDLSGGSSSEQIAKAAWYAAAESARSRVEQKGKQ